MADEVRVFECSFLIPLVRNSDREPQNMLVWNRLQDVLYETFGGNTGPESIYRSVKAVPGAYRDDDQQRVEDESFRYIVAVPEDRLDELRAILGRAANSFDQESIYLCGPGGLVEFVRPRTPDEFL